MPTIALTDNNNPDRESFLVVLDEPSVIRYADTIVETLPNLVAYILVGQSNAAKEAVKEWIRNRQGSKIKASSIFKLFIENDILWFISVSALSVGVTALLLYFFRKKALLK